MKRIYKIESLLVSSLLFSACASKQALEPKKPLNIVHIMCDDHSFQTISAYGHPISQLAPTPNLDRLAAKGMLFNKAFVENSLSTPRQLSVQLLQRILLSQSKSGPLMIASPEKTESLR